MIPFDQWLATQGTPLAFTLDARRDAICEAVSARLSNHFPRLCYQAERLDAESFQQKTYQKTPLRFHNTLGAALRFRAIPIIEREYAWAWCILPRYGVTSQHLTSMVRWYFELTRIYVSAAQSDAPYIAQIERIILDGIERVTSHEPPPLAPREPPRRRQALWRRPSLN